jgi:tRNA pseudouridine38-40 synthase
MRLFIRLAYNGERFHGWQSQPNAVSVQETIEKALSQILNRQIAIVGAGRTDTGVHAKEMYAHFDVETLSIPLNKLTLSLNNMCGKDIAIYDIFEVNEELHARFSATARTYHYYVTYVKDPFTTGNAWFSPTKLDVDKMNRAAELLLKTSDFTSFAKLHSDAKTNICRVTEAKWEYVANPFVDGDNVALVFTITADRFLRNMVRAVVGTLVDVGRGKLSLEDFQAVIDQQDRCSAGTSMPAHALYLWKIEYPFEDYPVGDK